MVGDSLRRRIFGWLGRQGLVGRVALVSFLVFLLLVGGGLSLTVPVKVGAKEYCKYGELLSDKTKTIYVPWWRANNYKARVVTRLCDKHRRAEELYAEARDLVKQGNLAEAKKKLAQAALLTPTIPAVRQELARVEKQLASSAGAKAGTGKNGGKTPGSGKRPPAKPSGPGFDLSKLLPSSIPAYAPGKVYRQNDLASRDFRPLSPDGVEALLLSVQWVPSAKTAAANINRARRDVWRNDQENLDVRGYTGHFGTDGKTYAYLVWYEKKLIFQVQAHSSGGTPWELKEEMRSLADEFGRP